MRIVNVGKVFSFAGGAVVTACGRVQIIAPKPLTSTAPGFSIERLRGPQLPKIQQHPLPVLASLGIETTRERCALPHFGAINLRLRPCNADEAAVFLADATLAFRASRGVVG